MKNNPFLRWTEDLEKHLGIHRKTADRYIADARRYQDLRIVASGGVVEIQEGLRKERIGENDGEREAAEQLLLDIETGQTRAARAWAGFRGNTKSGGKGRADADARELLRRAMVTLQRQLPRWRTLTAGEQQELKDEWIKVMTNLPKDLS